MTASAAAGPYPALSNVAWFLAMRRSPASLPRTPWFAAVLALAAIALPEVAFGDAAIDARTSLLSCTVAAVFLCAVPWLLAWSSGHCRRYSRGLVGLASVDLVLLPAAWWFVRAIEQGTIDLEDAWLAEALAVGVLFAWMLALRIRVWMFLTGQGAVRCGVLAVMLVGLEVWAHYVLQ